MRVATLVLSHVLIAALFTMFGFSLAIYWTTQECGLPARFVAISGDQTVELQCIVEMR